MTISTISRRRSRWAGMNVAEPLYYDGHWPLNLLEQGSDGWWLSDQTGVLDNPAMPVLDANGWAVSVAAGRRIFLGIMNFGSYFRQGGTWQVDFDGAVAGGGTMAIQTWEDRGSGYQHYLNDIPASGTQFEVGAVGDESWTLRMDGPITACPTNIRIWRVAEGNPTANFARQSYKDLWAQHGWLRWMDAVGPIGWGGYGTNNGGSYGGIWGPEWVIRTKLTGGADKSPFYLAIAGDNGALPSPGQTVTGGTSGFTGVLLTFDNPHNGVLGATAANGDADRRYFVIVQPTAGTPVPGEVLTFGTSNAKCVVDTDPLSGTAGKAVRFFDHASVTRPAFYRDRAGGLYEAIQACNEAGTGLWLCLPQSCTVAYATGAATLIRDTLYPWNPVYIETANEAHWNDTFFHTMRHYAGECARNGFAQGGSIYDAAGRGYGHHASLMADAFEAVFTGATHGPRLTRVISGQNSFPFRTQLMLDFDMGAGDLVHEHFDALAEAPYINNDVPAAGTETTAQHLYDNTIEFLNGNLNDWGVANQAMALARGLFIVGYEGGAGYFQLNIVGQEVLNALKFAFQTNALMGSVIEQYAAKLTGPWGYRAFGWFNDIKRWHLTTGGYWGISETIFDLTGPKPVFWLAELASHSLGDPTNLTFTNVATTSMTVGWTDNSGGLAETLIYRRLESETDLDYELVGTVAAGTSLFNDTGLTQGTTYRYDPFQQSPEFGLSEALSGTQATNGTGTPTAPTAVAATPLTTTSNRVAFTHAGADSFNVKRRPFGSGGYATVATGAASPIDDVTAVEGMRYEYVVTAVVTAVESANSAADDVYTKPSTPTATSLIAQSTSVLRALWANVSANATSVLLERSATGSGGWTTVLDAESLAPGTTTFDIGGLSPSQALFVRVTERSGPVVGGTLSAVSNTVTGTTNAGGSVPGPATITQLQFFDKNTVDIFFNGGDGATSNRTEWQHPDTLVWSTVPEAPGMPGAIRHLAAHAGRVNNYRVISINGMGEAPPSAVAGILTITDEPVAPMMTSVDAMNNRADCAMVTGATSSKLQRSLAGIGSYTQVAAGVTPLFDTTAVPGVRYDYRCIMVNSAGDSLPGPAAAISTRCNPPTQIDAVQDTSTQNRVYFTSSAGADSYGLKRRSASSGFPFVTVATGPGEPIVDPTASPGVAYDYAVVAINPSGESAISVIDSVTTLGTVVGVVAPVNVQGAATGYTSVMVNGTGATVTFGYVLERSADGTTGWVVRGAQSQTLPIFDQVEPGSSWFYRLKAANAEGVLSDASLVVGPITTPTIPLVIENPSTNETSRSYQSSTPIFGASPGGGAALDVLGYEVPYNSPHVQGFYGRSMLRPKVAAAATLREGVLTFGPVKSAHLDADGNGLTGEVFSFEINQRAGGCIDRLILTEPGAGGITAENIIATGNGYGRGMQTAMTFRTAEHLFGVKAITRGSPTTITLDRAHGVVPGKTFFSCLKLTETSPAVSPDLDGHHMATAHATDATKLTIPVDTATGAVGTYAVDSTMFAIIASHNPTEAGGAYSSPEWDTSPKDAHASVCLEAIFTPLVTLADGTVTSALIETSCVPCEFNVDGLMDGPLDSSFSTKSFDHGGNKFRPVFWTGMTIHKRLYVNPVLPGASKGFPGALKFEVEIRFTRPLNRLAMATDTFWRSTNQGGVELPNTHVRGFDALETRVFSSRWLWRGGDNTSLLLTGRVFATDGGPEGTWDDTTAHVMHIAGEHAGVVKIQGGFVYSPSLAERTAVMPETSVQGLLGIVVERATVGTRFAFASIAHVNSVSIVNPYPPGRTGTISYVRDNGIGTVGAEGTWTEALSVGGIFKDFASRGEVVGPYPDSYAEGDSIVNWAWHCYARTGAELLTSWNGGATGKLALLKAAVGPKDL